MPSIKRFPVFHTTLSGPHTNTKQQLYCIHKNKKHYEHTTYPTHLKLRDKNKDETADPPQSMCFNVPVGTFQCSNSQIMLVLLVRWMTEQPILELSRTQSSIQTSLWITNC